MSPWHRRIASVAVRRAAAAARAGRYGEAAGCYADAIRATPGRARLHVQRGHMLKEAGFFADAERDYAVADRLRPGDADLALQFGHLYKLTGRIAEADRAYRRAQALRPDWSVPAAELAGLAAAGWQGAAPHAASGPAAGTGRAASPDVPVPALLPPLHSPPPPADTGRVEIRRLGRIEPGRWGDARTVRGLEAIRGYTVSVEPIVDVTVIMNGLTLFRGPPAPPLGRPGGGSGKHAFNIWHDFSGFAPGRYPIEIRMQDAAGATRSHHDRIVVAEPRGEGQHPNCDALITLDPDDPRPAEDQLAARASVVHDAARALLRTPPRAILVQRTDQLGDMVASIPAIQRLRALFPDARIVGLLTQANADFAATVSVFDEIVTIDFPDDPVARRRLMPADAQAALRARLAPYRFDVAIDLATSGVSRPLLPLSGAPFLLGFGNAAWPWLSAGFEFDTHDPRTGLDIVSHSAKLLAMVEALGAVLTSRAQVMRRDDLSRARLVPLGIAAADRFVVLHAGARIGFSHWPHHAALAGMILARTACTVVMLTEDAAIRAALPPALTDSGRFVLLDRRLPFDDLDALASFCTVLVGNDSGPKHLASLRGVPVVTLFANRISYAEWGQELTGAVMTRKVPCAGCQILHDTDECGKGFVCITGIRPEEVLDVVLTYL